MIAEPKTTKRRKPTLLKIQATKLEMGRFGVSGWTISRFKGGIGLSANPLGHGCLNHVIAPRRVWVKVAKFIGGEI